MSAKEAKAPKAAAPAKEAKAKDAAAAKPADAKPAAAAKPAAGAKPAAAAKADTKASAGAAKAGAKGKPEAVRAPEVVLPTPRIQLKHGVTARDVEASALIAEYAKHLKLSGDLPLPKNVDVVKTGKTKELGPYEKDWYYVRAAAIARKVYMHRGIGIGLLTRQFGEKGNRGAAPDRKSRSARGHLRRICIGLQKMGVISKSKQGGRTMTKVGMRDLDRVAVIVHKNKILPGLMAATRRVTKMVAQSKAAREAALAKKAAATAAPAAGAAASAAATGAAPAGAAPAAAKPVKAAAAPKVAKPAAAAAGKA